MLVHVDTASSVFLERREVSGGEWQRMCDAPCDRQLPRVGDYRVRGNEIKTSAPFTLPDGERVMLRVDGASTDVPAVGTILIVSGVITSVAGLLALAAASVANALGAASVNGIHWTSTPSPAGSAGPGAILLVVGGAALASGIVIRTTSGETAVVPSRGDAPARAPEYRGPAWTFPALVASASPIVVRF